MPAAHAAINCAATAIKSNRRQYDLPVMSGRGRNHIVQEGAHVEMMFLRTRRRWAPSRIAVHFIPQPPGTPFTMPEPRATRWAHSSGG